VSAFSHESIGEPEKKKNDVGGQGPRERPQTSEPVAVRDLENFSTAWSYAETVE
jgi:hypothetical protein